MPRRETVLRVFVASPGDVAEERDLLEEVVRELNDTWSREFGIRLDLIRWETHAYPSIGVDAQDVINRQIGDEYDIFVGIMWSRFGTPTHRAESGTEEEFRRAYSRFQDNPETVSIMFYFKDVPIAPSRIDGDQIASINEFRRGLGEMGTLYWTFVSREDFSSLLRMHLSRQVQDWSKRLGQSAASPNTQLVVAAPAAVSGTPVAVVEDDGEGETEEVGVIDLIELAEDGVERLNLIMFRIAGELERLAEKIAGRSAELNAAASPSGEVDRKVIKRVSARAADDMKHFVSAVKADLPLLSEATGTTFEVLARAAPLFLDFDESGLVELYALRDQMSELRPAISNALNMIVDFRATVAGTPRITTEFNAARRQVVNLTTALTTEFTRADTLAAEVESVIAQALGGDEHPP